MANLNGLAGDVVGQVVTNLLNRFSPFIEELEATRQIIRDLKLGRIELSQVKSTEYGGFHVPASKNGAKPGGKAVATKL